MHNLYRCLSITSISTRNSCHVIEQSAMQRQASLLAMSATTKSTWEVEKTREILTMASKVKHFLTPLIQLTDNSSLFCTILISTCFKFL